MELDEPINITTNCPECDNLHSPMVEDTRSEPFCLACAADLLR